MIEAREIDGELWIKASDHHRAIAELKSQEPVGEFGWAANIPNTIGEVHWKNGSPPIGTKLYTHPPQRTEQESVAFLANAMRFKLSFDSEGKVNCFWNQKELDGRWVALVAAEDDCHLKLTHPPQRTWVGLTDEDQFNLVHAMNENDWDAVQMMDAIEAKLKEKNNA